MEQRRRELAVLHQAEANRELLSVTLVSPASAFWLVPQLAALGLSEAFNQVSQMEFYYKQFPENMRSVAGSLLFTGLALSLYLSGLLAGRRGAPRDGRSRAGRRRVARREPQQGEVGLVLLPHRLHRCRQLLRVPRMREMVQVQGTG